MRLVITQSTARVDAMRRRLAERGHDSLLLPFSTITDSPSAPDPATLRTMIAAHDRIVPVSPTAIERMLAACADLPRNASSDACSDARSDLRSDSMPAPSSTGAADAWAWPPHARLAVVGPGSLRALADGLSCAVLADVIHPVGAPFDADHLIMQPGLRDCAGLRVLVLRGETGSERWIDVLRQRGAIVTVLGLYRNTPVEPGVGQRQALHAWLASHSAGGAPPVCWLFSQAAVAIRCCAWLRATGQSALPDGHRALAIHPRIARTLADQGWRHVSLIEPGEASLLAAIESCG